jgi:uncharacterized membrane protein
MKMFKYSLSMEQKITFITSVFLCILCISWEWFLAPLRPNGSMMILKMLPIAFLLPGIYRGNNYQMQALSMVILLYFLEGFTRLFEKGLNPWLAGLEIILCSIIFWALLKHLGPIKKAAREKLQADLKNDHLS